MRATDPNAAGPDAVLLKPQRLQEAETSEADARESAAAETDCGQIPMGPPPLASYRTLMSPLPMVTPFGP